MTGEEDSWSHSPSSHSRNSLLAPAECSDCWQPCPSHLARCRGCGDGNCSNSQTRLNYWKGESWILKWWLGSSCPHGTLSTGALSCVAADSVIHEMEPDTFGKEQVLFDLLPTPIFLLPPHNNQYSLLNPGVWSHHPIVAFYLTVVVLSVVYLIFHQLSTRFIYSNCPLNFSLLCSVTPKLPSFLDMRSAAAATVFPIRKTDTSDTEQGSIHLFRDMMHLTVQLSFWYETPPQT